ncbi:MAG TPA: hypothetical protein VJN89_01255 [Candidatus Acidoferrum sp.]|nr:hypothetical protein [Candidatus Acidoferrum sp.]
MTTSNLLFVAAPPVVCAAYFGISVYLNKKATEERLTANSLAVLSGMLAALAILIPLGATLLPEKHFAWPAWLLVGSLFTSAACLFGTIYSMIGLQAVEKFNLRDFTFIPSCINATWFALGLLAFGSVLIKAVPATTQERMEHLTSPLTRFVVAHDLPVLGTSGQLIETGWGTPTSKTASELLYRTKDGVIAFCLDSKGALQSINESKEAESNAVGAYCR